MKTIHIIPAILLLGVCLIAFFVYNYSRSSTTKAPVHVPLREDEIHGLDLSHYSGRIDFERLRELGYEFVFLRSSMGFDGVDRMFHRSMHQARRAGFKTGVYHFFRFGESGREQARHFLSVLTHHSPDLPLVLDVEEAGINASATVSVEEVVREVRAFIDFVRQRGHTRLMVYSNRKGYWKYLHGNTDDCLLWIASPERVPPEMSRHCTFWQYRLDTRLHGVEGYADCNRFNGGRQEWEAFLER